MFTILGNRRVLKAAFRTGNALKAAFGDVPLRPAKTLKKAEPAGILAG
jgi:hypothetical protein